MKFQNEARTGKSRCVKCLANISTAEFLANDHLCAVCHGRPEEYPLASTPHEPVYDYPDRNCFTAPDGECISESECMHGPGRTGSGPQASPRPTPNYRYIHVTEYVDGSVFLPGWIDADAYPWAAALRLPGDCDDLFCDCHVVPTEAVDVRD